MTVEREIRDLLLKGHSPQELIGMGYKKSTVYKVYSKIKTFLTKISKPRWIIEDIYPPLNEIRFLPGDNVRLRFRFRNNSDQDLYLYKIGIQPEWLKDKWYAQEVRDLIKSGQSKYFTLSFSIPEGLQLGEYIIKFGIEGYYLPITNTSETWLQTQWSEPLILHVNHPQSGIKVFISHSFKDISLIRQLENMLDNYGIQAIILEDIPEPGINIKEKIMKAIEESTLLLAVLTKQAIKSKWVLFEIEYAYKIGKPIIPLREKGLKLNIQIINEIEWIDFSKHENIMMLTQDVLKAIENVRKRLSKEQFSKLIFGGLLLGILTFILSLTED